MDKLESMQRHKLETQHIVNELLNWKRGAIVETDETLDVTSHIMREKKYKSFSPSLSLKKLNSILEIDPVAKTVIIEPYVTQVQLVDALLPLGLLPPVVAEFKKITFGGGVNGSSLESSSHRHGQMNDSVISYELLLGDGSIVNASKEENADLYYAISGSYGCFALVLSMKIQLVEAPKLVEVTIYPFEDLSVGMTFLRKLCHQEDRPDYIEALIFNKNLMKVIVGDGVNSSDKTPVSFAETSSEWFHKLIYESEGSFVTPVRDYLFRYDRGAFWMGTYAKWPSLLARFLIEDSPYFPQSFINLFIRHDQGLYNEPQYPGKLFCQIAGRFMDSFDLYKWLHWKREHWFERHFVIQDFYLPEETALEFIEKALDITEIKPLWICPCLGTTTPQLFSPHHNTSSLLFDVGIYGWPIERHSSKEATQILEKECYRLNGKKMFYSWNYMNEEELFSHYPQKTYDELRLRSFATSVLPTFVDKISLTNS